MPNASLIDRRSDPDRRSPFYSQTPSSSTEPLPDRRASAPGPRTPAAVQRLCGRWLTWYRLHAGWSTAAVARAVGISASDLTRLELGHSDPTIFPDAIRARLVACFMHARPPHLWMAAVILGACGSTAAMTDEILSALAADLASGSAAVPFWHTSAHRRHLPAGPAHLPG